MVKYLVARGYGVHSRLGAYSPCYAKMRKQSHCSRVSMLGDALIALSEDKLKIVAFLIKHGADTENVHEHFTLLESALLPRDIGRTNKHTYRSSVKIFDKLFSVGASVDRSPRRGLPLPYGSILSRLIEYHADDSLICRVIDVTKDVNEGGNLPNALCEAIRQGRWSIAEKLLERGATPDHPVDRLCRPPLESACMSASVPIEFIVSLIQRGARIDTIPDHTGVLSYDTPFKGRTGISSWYTPLSGAASSGKLNVASLLLQYGADVNAFRRSDRASERTALDVAASNGRLDMVQLLRDMGGLSADRGITGVDGAIRYATEMGHYGVAEFLRQSPQSNEPRIVELSKDENGDPGIEADLAVNAEEFDKDRSRDVVHEVDCEDLET
ncbi:ankyrin repeat-containing domain protein [Nemania abortiva]|nr:ankyrin repeat-containing domain protein [Nemania abortiva]